MRDFWLVVTFIMVALRRALMVAWVRINKFLSNSDWLIQRTTEYHHKVVIIGDGFAEGLGDWITLGGSAGLVRQLEKLVAKDEKVRMRWEFVNRGKSGTTSADWLPSDEKSLYARKVESAVCRDAEIFVVCLGTMDLVTESVGMPVAAMRKNALDDYSEDELCETVRNVREICEALRSAGKKVIFCNVMTSGVGITDQVGTAKRVNRQLTLYARQSAAEAGRKNDGVDPARLVKLNNPRSERNDGRAFDGLHLNARGYRAFADSVYEPLGPMMVSVEWKVWKTKLPPALVAGAEAPKSRSRGVAVVSGANEKPKGDLSKKVD